MQKNLRNYFNIITDPYPTLSMLNNQHERNVSKSKRILFKIREWDLPRMLSYLRKIDPYVFEELILTSFNEQGHRIKRNARYSGDGGLDGKVYIRGNLYLIQAKRYISFINTNHVQEFAELISTNKDAVGGFFIHTGRTPTEAKRVLKSYQNIILVSGQKLVDLFQQQLKIEV